MHVALAVPAALVCRRSHLYVTVMPVSAYMALAFVFGFIKKKINWTSPYLWSSISFAETVSLTLRTFSCLSLYRPTTTMQVGRWCCRHLHCLNLSCTTHCRPTIQYVRKFQINSGFCRNYLVYTSQIALQVLSHFSSVASTSCCIYWFWGKIR